MRVMRTYGIMLIGAAVWFGAVISVATSVAADEPAATGKVAPTKTKPAQPQYEFRVRHDPNGIGKFYMGREIAHVMGFAAAAWLEREEREDEERLSLLIEALELQQGWVVADVGAGSGRISLMIAEKVGKEGKVLAVDVQQKMLDLITKRVRELEIDNVDTILGTAQSPKLPPESVDLIVMVDVYHEFEFPYEMLAELSRALKTGGRIAFVEYRLEDENVPIKLVHKMSREQVQKEASPPEFGLAHLRTDGRLPRQHVIIFEKKPAVIPPSDQAPPPTK
jgi:precorrin-6B methylase 2